MDLIRLRSKIFGTPLAIHPEKLEAILSAIGLRLGLLEVPAVEAGSKFAQPAQNKQLQVTKEGIAIIPIEGSLMQKSSGLMAMSGVASYETIKSQLQDAIANPSVKGLLLDID